MTDDRLPATYQSVPTSSDDAARSRGVALLNVVAADLEPAPRQPQSVATAASDMEQALARFRSLETENCELRETVRTQAQRIDEDAKLQSHDLIRMEDQLSFLQQQNTNLQQQRDTFANYAIEVKTRMTNLTTVMATNASHVEEAIETTMNEIRTFTEDRVDALSHLLTANAATASALVNEALAAAKNDTIVRLQNDRQTA